MQVEICLKNSLPQTAKPQASPAGTEQSARGGGRGKSQGMTRDPTDVFKWGRK